MPHRSITENHLVFPAPGKTTHERKERFSAIFLLDNFVVTGFFVNTHTHIAPSI